MGAKGERCWWPRWFAEHIPSEASERELEGVELGVLNWACPAPGACSRGEALKLLPNPELWLPNSGLVMPVSCQAAVCDVSLV